jgi:hypothetical protein
LTTPRTASTGSGTRASTSASYPATSTAAGVPATTPAIVERDVFAGRLQRRRRGPGWQRQARGADGERGPGLLLDGQAVGGVDDREREGRRAVGGQADGPLDRRPVEDRPKGEAADARVRDEVVGHRITPPR